MQPPPRPPDWSGGQPFLGREFSSEPDYSDEIAREIDDEIRRIVEEAHQTARSVLEDHRQQLDLTSEILLRRETIERAELGQLLQQEPWRGGPAGSRIHGGTDGGEHSAAACSDDPIPA